MKNNLIKINDQLEEEEEEEYYLSETKENKIIRQELPWLRELWIEETKKDRGNEESERDGKGGHEEMKEIIT